MSTTNGNPSDWTYSPEFCAMIAQRLADMGVKIKRWIPEGLETEDGEGKSNTIFLTNLYRRLQTCGAEDEPKIIQHFLQHVGGAEAMPKMPATIEEGAAQLRIRIGKPFARSEAPAPWTMPIAHTNDLTFNLVLDFPSTMAFVTTEMMAKSSTDEAEWVRVGIENLKTQTPGDWLQVMAEEGIFYSQVNDSYDAARALILNEHPETPENGWLLCLPARDRLYAMKAVYEKIDCFHYLKMLALRDHESEPYPISTEVYWVRRGKPWEHFPITIADNTVSVIPPIEFIMALNLLQPNGAAGTPPDAN